MSFTAQILTIDLPLVIVIVAYLLTLRAMLQQLKRMRDMGKDMEQIAGNMQRVTHSLQVSATAASLITAVVTETVNVLSTLGESESDKE